ncbi:SRPBCC domain-containing protein [Spirilliplanes yamanashiensis]|uniref:Transcriptional regulator n=1 Tax=Spirilliplanes yamanashiensis TaxID=42233 RepID=A0A8J3YC08_9ACTN|nr:SRPBCC domain-containing protein [Spirilliplanes yamanashiensis]MDP9816429.1 uncharacterized protein YndB with AHSA1/START domain [Spirilliplanes yamanashiensis]GIJ05956.1 transcriptional regulator [Spirilliplanes yamanashiensis]
MTTTTDVTTQVYRVYINAPAQKIWDTITTPEWNRRYGYGAPQFYELKPGGAYRATASDAMNDYHRAHGLPELDTIGDGEILECDPPRRLVQTWRMLMDPTTAAEPFTTLTYEIAEVPAQPGVHRLTVVHDVTGAPATAALTGGSLEDTGAGGGWPWVLSDLKSLIETGKGFTA